MKRKARTANSIYPKGGVSCSADTFVQAKSSIVRMKFSGKNPALQVAANRYLQGGAVNSTSNFGADIEHKNANAS